MDGKQHGTHAAAYTRGHTAGLHQAGHFTLVALQLAPTPLTEAHLPQLYPQSDSQLAAMSPDHRALHDQYHTASSVLARRTILLRSDADRWHRFLAALSGGYSSIQDGPGRFDHTHTQTDAAAAADDDDAWAAAAADDRDVEDSNQDDDVWDDD